MEIKLSTQLPNDISLAYTEIEFQNNDKLTMFWEEQLNPLIERIGQHDTLATIREDPIIQVTKKLYRTLGKDPSRFRPSSDSLLRRVVKGKGLYQVNALVDLNNYLSLKYRLPFGSYDLERIQGAITLTKGQSNQEYPGIGKKMINLENLLILEDQQGPFGSSTSDSTRTMIKKSTTHAVIVCYAFSQSAKMLANMQIDIEKLIKQYVNSTKVLKQELVIK